MGKKVLAQHKGDEGAGQEKNEEGKAMLPHMKRGDDLAGDSRNWRRDRGSLVSGDYRYEEYEDDDDEDEEQEDRSLDLLVKFVQNIFKKFSRKVRKAVRSVLPISISSQLVAFSVNGVIILTFLWLSKAVLEVFCTLRSVVFASILLIRGV